MLIGHFHAVIRSAFIQHQDGHEQLSSTNHGRGDHQQRIHPTAPELDHSGVPKRSAVEGDIAISQRVPHEWSSTCKKGSRLN